MKTILNSKKRSLAIALPQNNNYSFSSVVGVLGIVLILFFIIGCSDSPSSIIPTYENTEISEMSDKSDDDVIEYLKKIMPHRQIQEFESESDLSFSLLNYDVYIDYYPGDIPTLSSDFEIYSVQAGSEFLYIAINTKSDLYDHMESASLSSSHSDYFLVLDENYEIIDPCTDFDMSSNTQSGVYDGEGCASPNVLHCMQANCQDAGWLLCGGCLLVKKCVAALTILCIMDVAEGYENPIYCD